MFTQHNWSLLSFVSSIVQGLHVSPYLAVGMLPWSTHRSLGQGYSSRADNVKGSRNISLQPRFSILVLNLIRFISRKSVHFNYTIPVVLEWPVYAPVRKSSKKVNPGQIGHTHQNGWFITLRYGGRNGRILRPATISRNFHNDKANIVLWYA